LIIERRPSLFDYFENNARASKSILASSDFAQESNVIGCNDEIACPAALLDC